MPTLAEDDVLDFMVAEAIVARADELEQESDKEAEMRKWRQEGLSADRAATATPTRG